MTLTKRNHYNPCFWAAYWNFEYLKSKRENLYFNKPVRDVLIYSLKLKSNKILNLKTDNVFYEKKAGIDIITPEKALDFVSRNSLGNYDIIKTQYTSDRIIDFEDIFTKMEEAYKPVLEKIILTDINIDVEKKVHLAHFIIYQISRTPIILNSMQSFFESKGIEKFEMLSSLRNQLIDTKFMKVLVTFLIAPEWKIYKLKRNIFPLSDNPMMLKDYYLMFTIAPNMMIEINLKNNNAKKTCEIKNSISYFRYRKFIRRTINNSNREIIFGDTKLLEKIKRMRIYRKRFEKNTSANS